MIKIERTARICHIVLCLLNIGAIFFAFMKLAGTGAIYSFFRRLSMAFAFPMMIMRMAYLQYILFAALAVLFVIVLTVKIRNRTINAKCLAWDLTLWLVSFFELAYLELYYLNIITF